MDDNEAIPFCDKWLMQRVETLQRIVDAHNIVKQSHLEYLRTFFLGPPII